MDRFDRMKLQSFIAANPPDRRVAPAPEVLSAAYAGQLPECLMELWRNHGLGFYGPRALCLIDPRAWQGTLDRWIAAPADAIVRIPIALTPFGRIIVYRKLTEADEDVAALDPTARSMDVLTWDLAAFFNDYMCDPESADALISAEALDLARRELGVLEPGEVYGADPTLQPAQVLRYSRVDGLQMHQRLRNRVDAPDRSDSDPPKTVSDLLPEAFREAFAADGGRDEPATDLYFSFYVDRHRLLALRPDGTYRLLLWMTDARAHHQWDPYLYSGAYETARSDDGDEIIRLEMKELAQSSGRDFDDRELIVLRCGGVQRVLQASALQHIAVGIGWNGKVDAPDAVFARIGLSDSVPISADGGWTAPPWSELPGALQRLVRREPLLTTVNHVEPFVDDGDEDAMIMVTVDRGSDDGLSMNMPLCSPADAGKALRGWVWDLDAGSCRVGIDVKRDADDRIVDMPEIGDILTSRAPSADERC